MSSITSLALIGCGKMGSALLKSWSENPDIQFITVLDPQAQDIISHPKVTHYTSAAEADDALKSANAVVLAVKPQIMDKACEQIKPVIPEDALILSIAAGQTIASFETRFGENRAIIRAMPNTPAAIGKGISVLCANDHVSDTQKETAKSLLSSSGVVEWIEDETLMDAVTALSGGGPAYVFLLIELLAKAGETQGLSADMAMNLARQTVIGSAALAEQEADTSAAQLRENVTSPGGTTTAALEILMNGELESLLKQAVKLATERSKELSSS